jgi:hypothetical protein
MKTQKIQITRTISNLFIIGGTTKSTENTSITKPFQVHLQPEGISLLPLDEHILGIKMTLIELPNSQVIYTSDVSEDLAALYLDSIQEIIV